MDRILYTAAGGAARAVLGLGWRQAAGPEGDRGRGHDDGGHGAGGTDGGGDGRGAVVGSRGGARWTSLAGVTP